MARTGVLSDEYTRRIGAPELFPLDPRIHDNIYGQVLPVKGKKHRHRRIYRPRAPYLQHHELAKMMNPINVRVPHEAFGSQLTAAINSRPSQTFKQVVEQHDINFPGYSTAAGMLPENAYFMSEMELDPTRVFGQTNRFGTFPSARKEWFTH